MNATTTVRTYYFPEELWNIIKEYYGFIPDFPVRLGEVYERYAKHKKQFLFIPKLILKRELGIFNHQSWFLRTQSYGIEFLETEERFSHKNWLIRRGEAIRDVYKKIDVQFNFTHTNIKVGDKMKLHFASEIMVFKPDKDNVVPREDYSVAAVSVKEKEKGMVSFNPMYKAHNNWSINFVPVIVKSVSAMKVKLEYYKYNVTGESVRKQDGHEYNTFTADWSEPRGKIVCSWGNRYNLIYPHWSRIDMDNPEIIVRWNYEI